MAKRGPKRKPTALRVIEGTKSKNPVIENEAQPALFVEIPEPPAWLSKYAKEEWARVAPDLYGMGLLATIDSAVLAAYCQAFGRWQLAEEMLAKYARSKKGRASGGLTITTSNGNTIPHPLLSTANAAFRDMARLAAEFGLTPSARTQIEAKRGQDVDPLASKYGIG